MRRLALLLLAASALAGPPKAPECVPTAEEALRLARTRGKLIFLTVIVDDDHENRAVIDNVFRDREFLKISREFVCAYANYQERHGQVKVKGPDGKYQARCRDCPSITCADHRGLANDWARGFYPTSDARTPIHFVVNAKEELVDTIMNGNFEQGFNHVPAKEVVSRLKKLLDEHGRGLSEEEYKRMEGLLVDARAARARGLVTLELEKLLPVVALERDVEGVRTAQARIKEIDAIAAKDLAAAEELAARGALEQALEALEKVAATYPGTLSAAAADRDADDLKGRPEVKRILSAKELYEKGLEYKEKGRTDLARKRFEKCVRLYADTKYGELAAKELGALSSD